MTLSLIKPSLRFRLPQRRYGYVDVRFFPNVEGGFTKGILPKSADYLNNNHTLRHRYSRSMLKNLYVDKFQHYRYRSILDYILCTLMPTLRPFCIQYYKDGVTSPDLHTVLQSRLTDNLDDMLLKNLIYFNRADSGEITKESR